MKVENTLKTKSIILHDVKDSLIESYIVFVSKRNKEWKNIERNFMKFKIWTVS